jgi:hypothetical protein
MQGPNDHSNSENNVARRTCSRENVVISADIRVPGGHKNKVEVVEISQTGFRMECLAHIANGQTIFLTMPNFQQLEARVIWQTEWLYGCQFARPLHVAVFEHITSTYPALVASPKPLMEGQVYGADAGLHWVKRNVYAC